MGPLQSLSDQPVAAPIGVGTLRRSTARRREMTSAINTFATALNTEVMPGIAADEPFAADCLSRFRPFPIASPRPYARLVLGLDLVRRKPEAVRMKALVYLGPGKKALQDRPMPSIKASPARRSAAPTCTF
jgi:hypothetical protein